MKKLLLASAALALVTAQGHAFSISNMMGGLSQTQKPAAQLGCQKDAAAYIDSLENIKNKVSNAGVNPNHVTIDFNSRDTLPNIGKSAKDVYAQCIAEAAALYSGGKLPNGATAPTIVDLNNPVYTGPTVQNTGNFVKARNKALLGTGQPQTANGGLQRSMSSSSQGTVVNGQCVCPNSPVAPQMAPQQKYQSPVLQQNTVAPPKQAYYGTPTQQQYQAAPQQAAAAPAPAPDMNAIAAQRGYEDRGDGTFYDPNTNGTFAWNGSDFVEN